MGEVVMALAIVLIIILGFIFIAVGDTREK